MRKKFCFFQSFIVFFFLSFFCAKLESKRQWRKKENTNLFLYERGGARVRETEQEIMFFLSLSLSLFLKNFSLNSEKRESIQDKKKLLFLNCGIEKEKIVERKGRGGEDKLFKLNRSGMLNWIATQTKERERNKGEQDSANLIVGKSDSGSGLFLAREQKERERERTILSSSQTITVSLSLSLPGLYSFKSPLF